MSAEARKVFVGRVRYGFVARVGRVKGVGYGREVEAENKGR